MFPDPGNIQLKRAYEEASASDGERYLVDRLWPRGLSKSRLALTGGWLKDLAPSTGLRKWFDHKPERWPAFRADYEQELKLHQELLDTLKEAAKRGKITLIFGARNMTENEAVIIRDILLKGFSS